MLVSETSRCRERVKKYCQGHGLDIGYGGDPIVPTAITVDLPTPYTKVGEAPLNLGGDARNLYWFRDDCLDYVFSSHLLEDFEPKETKKILREWLRVLKPGGFLVLYLPDEQRYRSHCRKTGQPYNENHKIDNFSLDYMKSVIRDFSDIEVIHENPCCEDYSFEIVLKKALPTKSAKMVQDGRYTLFRRFLLAIRSFILIGLIDKAIKPRRFELQNFHEDNIWTNGLGIIRGIYYKVNPKCQYLILQTKGYHPYGNDPQKLGLKIFLNREQLRYQDQIGSSYYFNLENQTNKIYEIRIESSVFVPKEIGINEDVRTLGVDVDCLRLV